jgi:excinuclease ABC subunit A
VLQDTEILRGDGDSIVIHGAREHNLKNLSVAIPRGRFVVVTGVSGSGKSTLAFDLIFAEGQRRFLDSMNAYARQFVEQMSRPDVDLITGIPPTVSIEQRNSRGGGKSTVATVTEIYHFLRLLYARLGTQFCPDCHVPVEAQTRDQVGHRLQEDLRRRGDLLLLAPVVKNRKGFHTDVAEWAARHGYAEVRADGKIHSTNERLRLDRFREHDVEIVIGVLEAKRRAAVRGRRRDKSAGISRHSARASGGGAAAGREAQQLIDEALQLGHGSVFALDNHGALTVHSTERSCPKCGRSFEPLDPKNFSYNSSQGWCPKCRGFGELFYLPEDVDRGARADSIEESWWSWQEGERELCPECHGARLNPVTRAVRLRLSPLTPALSPRERVTLAAPPPRKSRRSTETALDLFPLLRGGGQGEGKEDTRLARRLLLEAGPTIEDFSRIPVARAYEFFRRLKFKGPAAQIARDILPEIRERLKFLHEVGLGYLELGRGVPTLSGGEAQRIRLAAQLGSNLSGVLYVLDEPTIGLHARDNEMLLATLDILKSRGNSLVVVEHDEATMRRADFILDLGPGAGVRGGQVVAAGTLEELLQHEDSVTGQCLRQKKRFPSRGQRRPAPASTVPPAASISGSSRTPQDPKRPMAGPESRALNAWLTLHRAAAHNLKNLTVHLPLNRLVVISGVSGSGKSTLIRECLLPALEATLKPRKGGGGPRSADSGPRITGHESIKAVYEVDQSPIGRTPRSTPATYVGFFDDIRRLFAQLPEARLRGYTASRFSFNSAQGRCPECEGAGTIKLEMNFLPPAFVRCETCQGMRFSRETLDIELSGKNIAQVLELSVAEAIEFLGAFPRIRRPLEALRDTGLDYLKLGQTSPTLSGGEAQRVRLVTHLLIGLKDAQAERLEARSRPEQTTDELPLGLEPGPAESAPSRLKPRASNLFILEEPTIGLHIADVRRLVDVLQRLVDAGHSVIVIEHNLDLIAEADWLIDLGPEGGDGGGEMVAEGTPEEVARDKRSHTGRFLRGFLGGSVNSQVKG